MPLGDAVDGPLDLLGVGDVAADAVPPGFRSRGLGDVEDGDPVAVGEQPLGDGAAEAAAAAGHHGDSGC